MCTLCRNGNNCCTKQNEGPDLNDPYSGVRCAKQILSDSYQVEDSGDSLRSQSFTSLMADLRQDTNRGFAFSRCLNGIFPSRNCSVKTLVH